MRCNMHMRMFVLCLPSIHCDVVAVVSDQPVGHTVRNRAEPGPQEIDLRGPSLLCYTQHHCSEPIEHRTVANKSEDMTQ